MKKYPLLEPIRFLVKTLTKFNLENKENLPEQGGVLITTNHLSRLDTPILLAITDRNDLVAIVAKKYREKPFFKWILEKVGTMVWMDRKETDFSAMRDTIEQLRAGAMVGIAPEGTRSRESTGLLEGKPGAALLVHVRLCQSSRLGLLVRKKSISTFCDCSVPPSLFALENPMNSRKWTGMIARDGFLAVQRRSCAESRHYFQKSIGGFTQIIRG